MDLINKCVLKCECLVSTCELVLPAANTCPHVTPCQASRAGGVGKTQSQLSTRMLFYPLLFNPQHI